MSCLLNGASCLLNVGRVVLGRVIFGASFLGGELSVIISMDREELVTGTNCPVKNGLVF